MINCRYPELNLDLTFKPVANENPQAFSREQIELYNETGYLTEVTLFEGKRLNSLARRFTEEAEECAKLNPHIKLSWVYNLVKDPALLPYLQDLMGPSIICHISRMIDKEPGSRYQFPGHQDCAFNAMDARCVVVWMALEDAVVENGCMWFVPGSHKLGALEVTDPKENLNLTDKPQNQAIEQLGKVPIELKAGKAIFFSDLVIHISPPNVTEDRSRKAFSMTFAPAGVKLHPDPRSNNSPILCCGENVEGNWNLIAPPGG